MTHVFTYDNRVQTVNSIKANLDNLLLIGLFISPISSQIYSNIEKYTNFARIFVQQIFARLNKEKQGDFLHF